MKDHEKFLALTRGFSQGGVDDEPADDSPADDYVPEGGLPYTGADDPEPQALEDDDFEPAGDEPEPEPANDGDEPEPEPEPEPTGDVDLRQQLESEREARLKLEGQLEQITRQLQSPKQPDKTPEQVRKYQQKLKEYVANGGDEEVAKRLQGVFDAFYEDISPDLTHLKSQASEQRDYMARQAADSEKRQAQDTLRGDFGATDKELAEADKFAQDYYKQVANGQAIFADYQTLFERSIMRQRHKAGQAADKDDKDAETKRLEAQRRANPGAGASKTNKVGPLKLPEAASFQELKTQLMEQGLVVDD